MNKYLEMKGEKGAMRTLIDVEDDKEAAFDNWIQEYTNTEASGISYTSKGSVIAEYKSLSDTIEMVGVVLAVILELIGLMNFANTMVTSIIVRSRELAMLEAVGMTGAQQKCKLKNYDKEVAAFGLIYGIIRANSMIIFQASSLAAFDTSIICLNFRNIKKEREAKKN